ncbi:MAG: carbon monoxide dehydrogenase [Rhodospirillaceae bacterium]|jgi:carbon-monoxide dehydrogenase medium subunit|uniref:FAD binding domain-containing protein n=1 Tax=Hwanghaeella sp. 1Z406 TaxID=3402811 RepID=UPI000C3CD270|nr:carbon monoxide dehydrogenase [Rhodospirillales bacterium]MAX47704.1 carbon monoxide dehydrogenase [Rhodospirillaceae bacterium]|tara:strand:+ start:59969 stop:60796 length:828 start_codon:yes stop_codon:yes gene_type:complete
MKPAPFNYAVAHSLDDAQKALAGGQNKLVSGNQSLGPMLNLRLARPTGLIDIAQLSDLRQVEDFGDRVRFGAATTHAEIEDGLVTDPTGHWMRDAAANIAYRAVRNRGTIGGSLAHADPAADWVIVMTALCATVLIRDPDQGADLRSLPIEDFITGPYSTGLGPDDVLTAIDVPRPGQNARWAYWKYTRQVGEFAKASAAILSDPENGRVRVAIGALGREPAILSQPQALLEGQVSPIEALQDAIPDHPVETLNLHAVALSRALAQLEERKENDA